MYRSVNMNKNQKVIATLSLLIATAVTVATSKVDNEKTEYSYFGAASNCANATTTNQAIVTSLGAITSPAAQFAQLLLLRNSFTFEKSTPK